MNAKELREASAGPLFGPAASDDKPAHLEHRQRLRARFHENGADSLPDYELLELVLFSSIPRSDTKPIAKALIKRFGSFGEVVSAAPEDLIQVKGVGEVAATALKAVQAGSPKTAANQGYRA